MRFLYREEDKNCMIVVFYIIISMHSYTILIAKLSRELRLRIVCSRLISLLLVNIVIEADKH